MMLKGLRRKYCGATEPGFRGRLLAQGQARSLIWREGKLPPDAPGFSVQLSYDLLSYGYGLLGTGSGYLKREAIQTWPAGRSNFQPTPWNPS